MTEILHTNRKLLYHFLFYKKNGEGGSFYPHETNVHKKAHEK